jgi:hypothetical protein
MMAVVSRSTPAPPHSSAVQAGQAHGNGLLKGLHGEFAFEIIFCGDRDKLLIGKIPSSVEDRFGRCQMIIHDKSLLLYGESHKQFYLPVNLGRVFPEMR